MILVILILVLSLNFNKKTEEKVKKKVSNEYIASYFDGEYQNEIPGKDDGYVVDKIVCDNGANATWDNEEWGINIRNATEKIKCSIYFIKAEYDFDYTGTEQEFIVHKTGNYKIELWGASGGGITINDTFYNGGLGGYVSGIISLKDQQKLYIYVGGSTSTYEGGYNGGAAGGDGSDTEYTGGGGSTDVRLVNGEWNDFTSLKSRIIVAAGGAGTGMYSSKAVLGGSAGGLNGNSGNIVYCYNLDKNHIVATGGFQTGGGASCQSCRKLNTDAGNGYFGYSTNVGKGYGTGGGSGYYGVGTGGDTSCNVSSGAGGSSFISGHSGCDAIKEESTEENIIHTGQSIHYSGMYFTDTLIIDGDGYKWTTEKGSYAGMPTHDGNSNMKGNTGNGYAKITYVG